MRVTQLLQITALAGALGALPAQAVVQPPAFASIDWSTFSYQLIDTNPLDGVLPTIEFLNQNSNTSASASSYDAASAADWSSDLSSASGSASATIGAGGLNAQFTALPSTLNTFAQASRTGSFIVSANTLVTFSVAAAIGVNLPVPLNGSAYSWSRFSISGPGFTGNPNQLQQSVTELLLFADGSGVPRTQDGVLLGSFYNGSGGNLTGQINAFSQVNSNGFIPVVPEPETYAMLLAGVGLLAAVARRRSRRD